MLTEQQLEYLLENYFKNPNASGWREIAKKMLITGRCIVSGNSCIWKGGIGNFIEINVAKDAYDCQLYTFNLKYFLSSGWFKENHAHYCKKLDEEITALQNKYTQLIEL